jgi:hypothetical protein
MSQLSTQHVNTCLRISQGLLGDYDLVGGGWKTICKLNPAILINGNPIYDHLNCANEAFLSDGCRILPCWPRLSKRNTMLQDLFLGSGSSNQMFRNSSTGMERRTKARYLLYEICGLT